VEVEMATPTKETSKEKESKETPTKEAPKKEVPKQLASKAESTATKKPEPEKGTPEPEKGKPEAKAEKPKPEAPKPMTLADMQKVVEALSKTVVEHSEKILTLEELLARKRKAVPNGRVEIKDTKTGKVYPSKNNTYQSLLKSGDLEELVAKGIFGSDPAKNNFGWFALQRAWPDRFTEIKPGKPDEVKSEQNTE